MAAAGPTDPPHASRRRLTIGRRLFYTHLLVALLVAFGLGSYLHWAAEAELKSALNNRLIENGTLAAEAIGTGNWESIRLPSDTQRVEYADLMRRLSVIVQRNRAIERLLVVRETDGRITAVADSLGATSGYAPGDSLAPGWGQQAIAGDGARAIAGLTGGFNALAPLSNEDGRYFALLSIASDDIDGKLEQLRVNSAVSFVLAVALALAMSIWLSRSAQRVLRRFSTRFREIAEGRLDQKLDLDGNDEFVDLAVALDEMATRLDQSRQEREGALVELKAARDRLEAMVRERSSELDRLNVMLRQEIEQRCQLEAALAEAAATDTMTRLLNRRGMVEALEHASEQARRQRTSFIVAVGDIDQFKRINDQFGHWVGDQVLIALGRRLKDSLSHTDAAGRWGGEEFVLLWPGLSITEGEQRANQLRETIAAGPIYPEGPTITISIGVAEFTGLDTLDRCISRADKALYRAKTEGRNKVCVGL
jgi:diguanylate cyclase (GGDEF)-like protein